MKTVAALVVLCSVSASVAVANTITVNDPADTTGGARCTLRDALASANSDTAVGGCAAGNGADTIQFSFGSPAHIRLTSNTQLTISSDVSILGPGAASLTIDGNAGQGGTRVFEVTAGTANISDITIRNGNAGSYNGGVFPGTHNGGGILVDPGAVLNLNNCSLIHNVAANGGAISVNNGSATLVNCTLQSNRAQDVVYGGGGGVFNYGDSAILTVNSCMITRNFAYDDGGGISNSGSVTVMDSALTRNTGPAGGGAIGNSGSALLINCTLSGNRADFGGGFGNGAPSATASILNCTLSGNRGRSGGGNIANFGSLSLGNTVVANSRLHGGDCYNLSDGFATITDLGHNLFDDSVANCGLTDGVNGDVVGVAAGLLRLANNGGPTKTMALCTGPGLGCKAASPALNAGDNSICQGSFVNDLDQRGNVRVTATDTICDIGAYEAP